MAGQADADRAAPANEISPSDFSPPGTYAFEPEFTGEPPRALPDSLDQGPHAKSARAAVIAFATFGVLGLAFSRFPGVDTLAYYVLPLGYLSWIGLGSLAVSALSYAGHALRRGPYRYVRDGRPLVARIMMLVKAPSSIVNGQPAMHAFTADIVFRDPVSGALAGARVKSKDFPSGRKDQFETPFKRGDYATAVYLPDDLEKSLRLYAFLDLSPTVNIRRQAAAESSSPWKLALLILILFGIFTVLFANIYAFGRYHPIDLDYSRAALPMVAGAIVLGGATLAYLYLSHRRERDKLLARAGNALVSGDAVELPAPFLGTGLYGWLTKVGVVAGAPLIGAGTALCWSLMANAWLDRSVPRLVPVHIENMTMTTHAFLFREYELEYRLPDSPKKLKLLTTPQHLMRFAGDRGMAQLREGWLHWPWVEDVLPVTAARPGPVPVPGNGPPSGR